MFVFLSLGFVSTTFFWAAPLRNRSGTAPHVHACFLPRRERTAIRAGLERDWRFGLPETPRGFLPLPLPPLPETTRGCLRLPQSRRRTRRRACFDYAWAPPLS